MEKKIYIYIHNSFKVGSVVTPSSILLPQVHGFNDVTCWSGYQVSTLAWGILLNLPCKCLNRTASDFFFYHKAKLCICSMTRSHS